MEINTAGIAGTAAATPEPYRNIYGRENVYALWLDISRDSGAVDRVLVLFQEEKIDGGSFGALPGDCMEPGALAVLVKPGSRIEVTGTIQTYKDKETGRTQLFVWGLYLAAVPKNSQQINIAYIKGTVAKQPVYREKHQKESILRILPYVFLRRLHLAFTVTYLALHGKSWQNRQQDYGKAAKCI